MFSLICTLSTLNVTTKLEVIEQMIYAYPSTAYASVIESHPANTVSGILTCMFNMTAQCMLSAMYDASHHAFVFGFASTHCTQALFNAATAEV